MAFSDLRCKINCIFTEWPLSGPLSRPRGGLDLAAGCWGSSTFCSGGHMWPYCTLMTICSINPVLACQSQLLWFVCFVKLSTSPFLGRNANLHSAYNGLAGKSIFVPVLLRYQCKRLTSFWAISILWDAAPGLPSGTLRNWLDWHFGWPNFGHICEYGFDIGIMTSIPFQQHIIALTMVIGDNFQVIWMKIYISFLALRGQHCQLEASYWRFAIIQSRRSRIWRQFLSPIKEFGFGFEIPLPPRDICLPQVYELYNILYNGSQACLLWNP